MKLFVLLALDVDVTQIVDDNPPENIVQAISDEIQSHLEDKTVRDAVGVTHVCEIRTEMVEGDISQLRINLCPHPEDKIVAEGDRTVSSSVVPPTRIFPHFPTAV